MKCLAVSLLAFCLAACEGGRRKPSSPEGDALPQRVERDYAKSAADVWHAALGAMEALELDVDDDRHDKLGGRLVGRRTSGDRLTVDVVGLGERRTRVVAQVDSGNGSFATMVHDRITERLGLSKAKASHFGGNSAAGRYSCTLSQAASAAQQVVRRLGLELLSIDVREQAATVDARDDASIPIRFLFSRVDQETIKAQFTVGTTPGAAAKSTAKRLKSEFERDLAASVEQ